jgi:hypothetical protein
MNKDHDKKKAQIESTELTDADLDNVAGGVGRGFGFVELGSVVGGVRGDGELGGRPLRINEAEERAGGGGGGGTGGGGTGGGR